MYARTTLIMSIVSISSVLFMACGLTSPFGAAGTVDPAAQTATEEHAPVQATGQPVEVSHEPAFSSGLAYPVVSTGQGLCYDDATEIACALGQVGHSTVGAPPQEALDACQGLSQGSACTVNSPGGALPGSCQLVGSGQLACVPVVAPPGGGASLP